MAKEPDNLVLKLLRKMRVDISRIQAKLCDVRRMVASRALRFDALEEKLGLLGEGTVAAIGLAGLAKRVEKLEAAK